MFIWKSRALTRAEKFARYASIIGTPALVVLIIVNSRVFGGHWYEYAALCAIGIWLIQAIAMSLLRRRARKLILDGHLFVCPRCGYDLDGLPESGACPECGDAYTPESLLNKWATRYDLLDLVRRTPATPSPPPPHTSPDAPTPPPGASTN